MIWRCRGACVSLCPGDCVSGVRFDFFFFFRRRVCGNAGVKKCQAPATQCVARSGAAQVTRGTGVCAGAGRVPSRLWCAGAPRPTKHVRRVKKPHSFSFFSSLYCCAHTLVHKHTHAPTPTQPRTRAAEPRAHTRRPRFKKHSRRRARLLPFLLPPLPLFFPPSRPCVSRRPPPPPWPPPPCPRRTSCWAGSRYEGRERGGRRWEAPARPARAAHKKENDRPHARSLLSFLLSHQHRPPSPAKIIQPPKRPWSRSRCAGEECVSRREIERDVLRRKRRAVSRSLPLRAARFGHLLNRPSFSSSSLLSTDQDDRAAFLTPALPGLADGGPGVGTRT